LGDLGSALSSLDPTGARLGPLLEESLLDRIGNASQPLLSTSTAALAGASTYTASSSTSSTNARTRQPSHSIVGGGGPRPQLQRPSQVGDPQLGAALGGGGSAPPLVGSADAGSWHRPDVLRKRLHTKQMPPVPEIERSVRGSTSAGSAHVAGLGSHLANHCSDSSAGPQAGARDDLSPGATSAAQAPALSGEEVSRGSSASSSSGQRRQQNEPSQDPAQGLLRQGPTTVGGLVGGSAAPPCRDGQGPGGLPSDDANAGAGNPAGDGSDNAPGDAGHGAAVGGGGGGGGDPDGGVLVQAGEEDTWKGGRKKKEKHVLTEEAWAWSLKSLRSKSYKSFAAIASELEHRCPEANRNHYRDSWFVVGESYRRYALRRFQALVNACLAAIAVSHAIGIGGVWFESWDETKIHVSVRGEFGEPYYHAPTQLMLLLMGFSIALSLRKPGGAGGRESVIIIGDLHPSLVPVGEQTGEVFSAVLSAVAGPFRQVLAGLKYLTDAACTDRAGANKKRIFAEQTLRARAAPAVPERSSAWWQGCKAHDQHHCHGESFSTVPRTVPRTAKLLGTVSFSGRTKGLRTKVKELLVIIHVT
jgi:hypothetical protein